MSSTFEDFLNGIELDSLSKFDTALHFIYFHLKTINPDGLILKEINEYFDKAHLPKFNVTKLSDLLKKSRDVIANGKSVKTFKLSRKKFIELEDKYSQIFLSKNEEIKSRADITKSPFLLVEDIEDAKKMSQLYLLIHCYENSARKLIERTLSKQLGANWWDVASSSSMKTKYSDRKSKEEKHKWISPRGKMTPLYYIDWGDLVTLIRKFPEHFSSSIPDINFVTLRFEELERLRNIIAHNGSLPSNDDFDRIILHFNDWCRQVA